MAIMLTIALAGEKWGVNTVGYAAYGILTASFVTLTGILIYGLSTLV